jgi:hypothetical protein
LVIQAGFDDDLAISTLGDEDFLRAVAEWEKSPDAEAARRSQDLERQLDETR